MSRLAILVLVLCVSVCSGTTVSPWINRVTTEYASGETHINVTVQFVSDKDHLSGSYTVEVGNGNNSVSSPFSGCIIGSWDEDGDYVSFLCACILEFEIGFVVNTINATFTGNTPLVLASSYLTSMKDGGMIYSLIGTGCTAEDFTIKTRYVYTPSQVRNLGNLPNPGQAVDCEGISWKDYKPEFIAFLSLFCVLLVILAVLGVCMWKNQRSHRALV